MIKKFAHLRGGNIDVSNEYTTLTLSVQNIKGLTGEIEIPLKNDVYAITGNNGTGKSTLISLFSRLVPPYTFRLSNIDYTDESSVKFSVYDRKSEWSFINGKFNNKYDDIRFEGRYEGSLFYGKRFEDSKNVEELIENGIIASDSLIDADNFIVKALGNILHNNEDHYKNIKRLRNREMADDFKLKNLPYFMIVEDKIVSQYKMSSGECLLLTLLHFLYNSIIRRSIPSQKHVLLLIDEIELALHPVAVKRLIEMLKDITKSSPNLTCIISSHSLEVIRNVPASNIFNLQIQSNINGAKTFTVDNPIYPCYLMKDLYTHNGYDYVIMVEDKLASMIVNNSISKLQLRKNKLIDVVPIGGWENVFSLHKTFVSENTLGLNTTIVSVIDGDVASIAEPKFRNLKHTFLPIGSIEKFLLNNLFEKNDISKAIKDTIFVGPMSLESFILEYKKEESVKSKENTYKPDNNGKRLYGRLKNYCESQRKISEDKLIDILYDIAKSYIKFEEFEDALSKLLI